MLLMAKKEKCDLLRGTLDMMILRTLKLEPLHGYGISQRLEQMTDEVFDFKAGSLFPALYRLERDGWIKGSWGASQNNRRAKFYKLTRSGRRRLEKETANWRRVSQLSPSRLTVALV